LHFANSFADFGFECAEWWFLGCGYSIGYALIHMGHCKLDRMVNLLGSNGLSRLLHN
jgi:hypothetical protein